MATLCVAAVAKGAAAAASVASATSGIRYNAAHLLQELQESDMACRLADDVLSKSQARPEVLKEILNMRRGLLRRTLESCHAKYPNLSEEHSFWDDLARYEAGSWVPGMLEQRTQLMEAIQMLQKDLPQAPQAAPEAAPAGSSQDPVGSQADVIEFMEILTRGQVTEANLPQGVLQEEVEKLRDFLTLVNQKPELFGGIKLGDPVEFCNILFGDFVDMLNKGIRWTSTTSKNEFISKPMLKDLFLACIWRSSMYKEVSTGYGHDVTFYWLLQQSRRSQNTALMDYYFRFWNHLSRWNLPSRNFADNISSFFEYADKMPLNFADMGSLWRGSCLSPDAVKVFDDYHKAPDSADRSGILFQGHISTSRLRAKAKDFVRNQADQEAYGQVPVLFEILKFLPTKIFKHIDLRMMGTRGEETEQEIVLQRPLFAKVLKCERVTEPDDEALTFMHIQLEMLNPMTLARQGRLFDEEDASCVQCEWM